MSGAVRTLVVRCPHWPAVAARLPPGQPGAVLEGGRVVAGTPAATAEGVAVGQRRRQAQAVCPDLVVVARDHGGEGRAFEAVVAGLEALTPRVEVGAPGTASFPTRGPSRYHGGDAALAALALAAAAAVLAGRGWRGQVGVGVADGRFAAELAAAAVVAGGGPVVVPPGGSAAFLAPLPVAALDRPELAELLRRLGLRTLGSFAALDGGDVVGRFGAEGRTAHRLARGLDERPPATAPPAPDLAVSAELDPPAERVDQVAFTGKALADELHARLAGRGLSCSRVLVVATSDHDEVHERLWRHQGLSPAALADRVRWQVEGWLEGPLRARPTAGVARLALVPDEVGPARGRQLGFWGGEAAVVERVGRAVSRLAGLLGPEAVALPEHRGGRGPGEQLGLVPASALDLDRPRLDLGGGAPGPDRPPWPGRVPVPSPALVHPRPLPAHLLDGEGAEVVVGGRGTLLQTPCHLVVEGAPPRPVVAWSGPWLAQERWWDGSGRRRARLQVEVEGFAHLLFVEGGRWWVEGTYA